jgi:hypothetical protein
MGRPRKMAINGERDANEQPARSTVYDAYRVLGIDARRAATSSAAQGELDGSPSAGGRWTGHARYAYMRHGQHFRPERYPSSSRFRLFSSPSCRAGLYLAGDGLRSASRYQETTLWPYTPAAWRVLHLLYRLQYRRRRPTTWCRSCGVSPVVLAPAARSCRPSRAPAARSSSASRRTSQVYWDADAKVTVKAIERIDKDE